MARWLEPHMERNEQHIKSKSLCTEMSLDNRTNSRPEFYAKKNRKLLIKLQRRFNEIWSPKGKIFEKIQKLFKVILDHIPIIIVKEIYFCGAPTSYEAAINCPKMAVVVSFLQHQ